MHIRVVTNVSFSENFVHKIMNDPKVFAEVSVKIFEWCLSSKKTSLSNLQIILIKSNIIHSWYFTSLKSMIILSAFLDFKENLEENGSLSNAMCYEYHISKIQLIPRGTVKACVRYFLSNFYFFTKW